MNNSKYTYLLFLDLSSKFVIENYHCHGGFFRIPSTSTFYDDIFLSNDVDITNDSISKFLSSAKGKEIVTQMFTKIYLNPVKKTLRKHKLINMSRLRLLVNLKILSKSKYIAVAKQLCRDTTDEDLVRMIKEISS